ncbi:hypothetical protein Mal64_20130 [Pseudobythopirellula maris]|uniref:Response regulatory domain-containing protein n=1 Tax=Pseudobythopirellula maris TaxID=2527991 RepID=A0A5C5ZMY6_9BACT|nr:DNA-binding response regulator [Pseudobythopirellula maris]TWT88530.1 hypothetical protein Mal64_20130 [Pseudobythopirellula maris]
MIVLISRDLMAGSAIEGPARSAGMAVRIVSPDNAPDPAAKLYAIDLSTPAGDLAALVAALRTASPEAAVVAYAPHVHEAKLEAARAAGCDEVLTRGQFYRSLGDIVTRHANR